MPFWRNGTRLSGTHHHSCWSEATETTGPKFPRKYVIPEIQESTTGPAFFAQNPINLGFLNYYRNYIPRLSEKLTPFFKLLTKDENVLVTPDLLEKFTEINKALDRCCELALKQPLPNKQIALMTDASISAAGYAVLIEDDPLEKYTSTRKAFAPVAYGSKTFSPTQLKMSIYAKEFLAIFFAFKEFGHIF